MSDDRSAGGMTDRANRLVGEFDWKEFGPGQPICAIPEISPVHAKRWLENNLPTNRKPSAKRVQMNGRDMAAGRWRLTHQGFAFDMDGVLFDGQHRCGGIITANTTIVSPVWFGVQSYEGIDTGRARSISNIRKMRGVQADARYVAIVRSLWRLDTGDWTAILSEQEFVELEEMYAQEIEWLLTNPLPTRYTAGVYAAMAYVHLFAPAQVEEFFTAVVSQAGLEPGSAALSFVKQMTARGLNTAGTENMKRLVYVTLGALRKHIEGGSVSFTRPSEEHLDWARDHRKGI